jgi:hypothetical protein
MQITINIPDNLPPAIVQQQISEFKEKLSRLMSTAGNKAKNQQAILDIMRQCASLPTLDPRTADEILGYQDSAMGLWGDE